MALEIARRLIGGKWATRPVDEAAGGGSQPQFIGPFTVPFDDPGVNNTYTVLTPLARKTTVIRVWAFNHGWASIPDGSGWEVTVDVQDSTNVGEAQFEVYRCDSMLPTVQTVSELSGSTIAIPTVARTPDNSDDYELAAYLFANGSDTASAGAIDFYALVNVET